MSDPAVHRPLILINDDRADGRPVTRASLPEAPQS